MAAFATATDVEDRWRPLTLEEAVVAQALLDDASAMLRLRLPTLDARVALDLNLASVAAQTVIAMVLRVLRNPEGKVQESIDDYSYRRADGLASGELHVTADELAQLAEAQQLGGAFSVSLWG